MFRTRRRLAAALAGLLTLGLVALTAPAPPAGAAGMTTHAWMAESAIDLVDDPALEALLRANLDQVRAGGRFPDGGYGPGNVYGEEAHWQRFFDVHAQRIADKDDCGDLTAPTGPCAAQIAHLLGAVAHGAGDEVWDWLFEPYSPDLDEYYLPEELSPFQDGGGQELTMDLVAVGVHDRPGGDPPALPFPDEVLASLQEAGAPGTTLQQIQNGQTFIGIVYQAEKAWVATHLDGVLANMPWMAANMVTAPGGVQYAAQAIAGQWESMWARLQGEQPPTEVSVTYPSDGQTGIPTGWVRSSYQPGSSPGRGGARTRIAASLTYAAPYRRVGGAGVSDLLPAGAMTLRERDTGVELTAMNGFPRVVPYGADSGAHTVAFQPLADLQPCTWYEVAITDALVDADGAGVVPHTWEFRTGQDAQGTACVDPVDPVEDYVRRAYDDVLGRPVDGAALTYWTDALAGTTTPQRFASVLVASAEHRRQLVRLVYQQDLGRAAEPSALDLWSEQLARATLHSVRAQVLASPEAYQRAGGEPAPWVAGLYQSVLGRSGSGAEVAYWTDRLAAGATRSTVSRQIAASTEAHRSTARQVHAGLLDQEPTAEQLAAEASVVAAADARALIRSIVGNVPYAPDAIG